MRHISFQYLIIFFAILFFACNNNNSQEQTQENVQPSLASYQLDIQNTKVIWNGYKTNDKVKVVGVFNEFDCERKSQEFSSIEDLVTGLNFSIKSSSSSSGDVIRDQNLNDYFFKYFTKDFVINGVLNQVVGDSIDVTFDVFGQTKQIRFGFSYSMMPTCSYYDIMVEIKGPINLELEFDAIKAYNSIHEKCYHLHKGSDGISRTWKHVDIHVKAVVINTRFPRK